MLPRHKFALSAAFSFRVTCSCNPSSSKNDSYSSLACSSFLNASSIFAASSRSFLRLPRDFRKFSASLTCLASVAFWRDSLLLGFSFRKLSERLGPTTTRFSCSSLFARDRVHDQVHSMTFQLTNSSYQTKIHRSKRPVLRTKNLLLVQDVSDDFT